MFPLLVWARGQLGMNSVSARVLSDNPALRFFLKFASETKRVPLRAVEEPGIIRLVEDETLVDAPVSLVYVTFKSQTLHEKPESRHDVQDFQDS
jgi:hypothetical protein